MMINGDRLLLKASILLLEASEMTKKLISIMLAMLLVFSVGAAAFAVDGDVTDTNPPAADEGGYDYTKDERFNEIPDINNGEFTYGSEAKCMYHIVEGNAVTMKEASELELDDIISLTIPTHYIEAVTIVAYYALKCPSCGQAIGAKKIFNIYDKNKGKCTNPDCEAKLPAPDGIVYRFIIVDFDSAHFDTFSGMNFVKRTKNIFESTANLYGEGKDLPFSFLEFKSEVPESEGDGEDGGDGKEAEAVINYDELVNFKTSGSSMSSFKSLMWDMLTKYSYRQEKHMADENTIKTYDTMSEILIKIIEGIGSALRFFPSLIF